MGVARVTVRAVLRAALDEVETDHLVTVTAADDVADEMVAALRTAPRAPTSLWVADDGTVYRLRRAEINPLTDTWHEDWDVLTVDGYMTKRYALPDDAVLVWSPA